MSQAAETPTGEVTLRPAGPGRLDRYRAGRRMDSDSSGPDAIANAIVEEIGRPVDYRPVETDAARRAAEKLAELL